LFRVIVENESRVFSGAHWIEVELRVLAKANTTNCSNKICLWHRN